MNSAILQLVQDATDDPAVALRRPSSLFPTDDDGDDSSRKMLRALTKTLTYLAATYDWQALRREHVFSSSAQDVQTGAIPLDFLRFVPDTFWNRTNRWRVGGPLSPKEWQEIKSWVNTSAMPMFSQRGNDIIFAHTPVSGLVCSYEYITNAIGTASTSQAFTAEASKGSATLSVANTSGLAVGMSVSGPGITTGSIITALTANVSIAVNTLASASVVGGSYVAVTPRTRFLSDTDTVPFDDALITQGIIWQYRMGERFDYAQDQASFQQLMVDRIKQDGGRRVINMRGGRASSQSRIDQMRSGVAVVNTPPTWGDVQW